MPYTTTLSAASAAADAIIALRHRKHTVDITYIPTWVGVLYVAVVKELFAG